jgi:CSLREA domain-containing protein
VPAHPATRAVLLTLLGCLLIGWAAPAVAAAKSFEVDTTADEADDNGGDGLCETGGGKCSLRAALTEVNEGGESSNQISFDPFVFNGE